MSEEKTYILNEAGKNLLTQLRDDLAALRERVERIEIELSGRDPIPGAPFVPPAPEREERWDDKYGRYFVPPAPRKEEPIAKRMRAAEKIMAAHTPDLRPEAQGEKAWSEIETFPARERRTWTLCQAPYGGFRECIHNEFDRRSFPDQAATEVTVVEQFPGETLAPQQEGPYSGPDPKAQGERVRVHETDLFHQCDEPKCPLRHYVAVILPEGSAAKGKT